MSLFANYQERPSCLSENDFYNWIERFENAIKVNWPYSEFAEIPTIEFSKEEKVLQYGSLSLNEIKDRIRGTWKMDVKIEGILENIPDYKTYRHGKYEALAGAIRDNNPGTNYYQIKEKIDEWFNQILFSLAIGGEYINSLSKIVFYTKNIEKKDSTRRTIKQKYEEVFAHEMFHAYHYSIAGREITSRSDYTSSVVKESLASAFECYYCFGYEIPGVDDLENSWNNYPVSVYPYSGAKNLIIHGNNSHSVMNGEKFDEVLENSISNMDNALRELLPENEFYDVKNIQDSRVRIGSKSQKLIPHFFKLSQKLSFKDETEDGYAFASDTKRHEDIQKIQKGDVVLSIFSGKLWALGIAANDAYKAANGHGREGDGWYVDIDYSVLKHPVDVSRFKNVPDYPIKRNEPYVRAFDFPEFINIVLEKAKAEIPNEAMLYTMVSNLLPKKVEKKKQREKDIYLEWDEGYRSFAIADRHLSRVLIQGRNCQLFYKTGHSESGSKEIHINDENYKALIDLFKEYYDSLSTVDVSSWKSVPYGGVGSYKYRFEAKENMAGSISLFEGNIEDKAMESYNKIIDAISTQVIN